RSFRTSPPRDRFSGRSAERHRRHVLRTEAVGPPSSPPRKGLGLFLRLRTCRRRPMLLQALAEACGETQFIPRLLAPFAKTSRIVMDRGAGLPMRMLAQETDRDAAAMMRQYELVERVRRYNPSANEDLLNRAYVFAMKAHGTQKRASGDPYFSHPLEVAAILTELKVDDATIVAAMLHDTIEDTVITREDVNKAFGEEIGGLVDGLTKLGKLDFVTKHAQQAENFRKLLLAIADDARVLLVKLADRLHNMRTLNFMPEEKRPRIAQDTLDIYAPLAGRMGMQSMRSELEDLSFRCLMPDAYALIVSRLETLKAKNGAIIARIAAELTDQFARRGIKVEVKGRQKQPYSIWKKMERRSIAFEQLSDIYGFRILVDTVADCYAAVGVAHTTWPSVPGRFKDYISTPKQNDYRSIHTTVIGPGSQRV